MLRLPRNAQLWLPGYVKTYATNPKRPAADVWVTIADHYEPFRHPADNNIARDRVKPWRLKWPQIASRHADSLGNAPRYTFFYPQEEYNPEILDYLAEMAHAEIADVEVHLHHDGEGEQNFVDRVSWFKEVLQSRHSLLRKQNGKIIFAFIHGNWALDNSLPDGRLCGLNNEITLLRDLGCYADFTLPSAPSLAQTRTVNTIYWAIDDPKRSKSHDSGIPLRRGEQATGDLLMIPGPLALDWSSRKWRLFPRLEIGELAHHRPLTKERVRLWLCHAPRVGDHLFLKLFAHGAKEENAAVLLGGDLERLFELLRKECEADGSTLHYATAWEMRKAVDRAHQKPESTANQYKSEQPA